MTHADLIERLRGAPDWLPPRSAALMREAADALEAVTSEQAVERGARALAGLAAGEPWPTNEEMGGGLTGTRDDEYRRAMREDARAVLNAAAGGGQ